MPTTRARNSSSSRDTRLPRCPSSIAWAAASTRTCLRSTRAPKLRIGGKLELEQAVTALTRYIALAGSDAQPSPAAAWWRKGNAQELMGKTAEAEASYEQSLRLNPDDEDVRQALENLKRAKSTGR